MACIDKENLLKDLITIYAPMQEQKDILVKCIKKVNEQPTADVEEVKHGEWIHSSRGFDVGAAYECSICHSPSGIKHFYRSSYVFCPDCGAKMDGKDIKVPTTDGGKEE